MRVWIPALRANTGADTFMLNLAAGLERRGVSVSFKWFPRLGEICPAIMGQAPPPGTDIIHVSSDYGFPFTSRGVPVVATLFHWVHGADYAPYRGNLQRWYHRLLLRRYQEFSLRKATVVTTISEYSAQQLASAWPGLHSHMIYPGIDTDFFHPSAARGVDGKFRLLFVGSPSRRKGFDLLPRLAALLGPEFELHYPEGPEYPSVGNLTRIGRLSRNSLRQAYQDCDAFILPTRLEGFGLVAAEAMACGKPVITSRCSSLPELVRDGETGILCPVDDVSAFVAAARKLRADREVRERMGRAGRERVLRLFTLESMTEQYLSLYQTVLGQVGAITLAENGVTKK